MGAGRNRRDMQERDSRLNRVASARISRLLHVRTNADGFRGPGLVDFLIFSATAEEGANVTSRGKGTFLHPVPHGPGHRVECLSPPRPSL